MGIEIENVTVTYLASSRPVILGLSLTAKKGEITSILGPTGSGKTTLFKAIAGLLDFEEASVFGRIVLDEEIHKLPVTWHKPISIVFQEPTLFPWLTVLGNIISLHASQLDSSGTHDSIVERAIDYLTAVGLRQYSDFRPYQLSGGMRARANLARALSFESPMVLLDEPFANLDEIMKERVAAVVSRHAAETQAAILMVTHNIRDAIRLSDSVYVLSGEPLDRAILWQKPSGPGNVEAMYEEVRAICEEQWYRRR